MEKTIAQKDIYSAVHECIKELTENEPEKPVAFTDVVKKVVKEKIPDL